MLPPFFIWAQRLVFINKINDLLHGAHGRQPNAALVKVHCIIYIYSVDMERPGGFIPGAGAY